MSRNDEKLAKFLAAINEYADNCCDDIVKETESLIEKAVKEAESKAVKQEELFVQHEYARLKNELSGEYSRRAMERRRELLEKRAQITEDVFNKAKAKLVEYTKTTEYENKITTDVRKSAVMFGNYMGATEFYVRPGDEIAKKCIAAIFSSSMITEDKTISIGGFRAVNLSRGVVADATLDSALEGRKDWFSENSGLSVSEV